MMDSADIRYAHDRERLEFERDVAEAQLARVQALYTASQAQLARTLGMLRESARENEARAAAFANAVEGLFNGSSTLKTERT